MLSKIMGFVMDPQCKALESFKVMGEVRQSDLCFEEVSLVVGGVKEGKSGEADVQHKEKAGLVSEQGGRTQMEEWAWEETVLRALPGVPQLQ